MTDARDVIATFYRSECGFTECKAYNETDAILTALREAGFAVVPVEPTEAMLTAGQDYGMCIYRTEALFTWQAMLKAAQGGVE